MYHLFSKSREVHDILTKYIKIHDDIFKFSFRKLIPIPGIFKAINYNKHYKELSVLWSGLGSIEFEINDSDDFGKVMKEYATALLITINCLKEICYKLYQKSQGNLSYSEKDYAVDMEKYNRSVEMYKIIGSRLNQYLAQLNIVKAYILDAMQGYYVKGLVVGKDISEEFIKGFVTPSGEIYILIAYEQGEPKIMITKREVWDKQRYIFELIEKGENYQEKLNELITNLKKNKGS